jgi:hypothetical protein
MNVFWVFIPGIVLLALGLIIFEWRHRREQLMGDPVLSERASEDSKS